MPVLIFGHDAALAKWVAERIPNVGQAGFGLYTAIGIASDNGPNAKLYGAIVYHDYQPHLRTCQISMAAVSPRWATRGTIRALLSVPFLQYNCYKVWVSIPHTNKRAIKVNAGIGMKMDAGLRHQYGPGSHASILSITLPEFEKLWLNGNGKSNGKAKRQRAAAA